MSIKVMSAIWDNSQQTGSALLMLLAIADHANDDGVCWPSVETLAQKARVKARQAQNLIVQLEESGELVVHRGRGRNNTSIYVVTVGGKGAIQRAIDYAEKVQSGAEKVQSSAEKVQSSALKGAIAIAPDPLEPSIEPSLEPLGRAAAEPSAPPPAAAAPSVMAELPEQPATTKTLTQQPAIVAYHEIFLAYPSKAQMTQILRHGIDDTARWNEVLGAWCRSGYNPRNIGGMLDWYDNPERMAGNGRTANPPRAAPLLRSKVDASMDAVDRVMAMIEQQAASK